MIFPQITKRLSTHKKLSATGLTNFSTFAAVKYQIREKMANSRFRAGLFAMVICPLVSIAGDRTVVWDKTENNPVIGASVISSKGIIMGITDSDGAICVEKKDFPLSLRSLGFEPLSVNEPADTIFMTPASYQLSEVVVTPEDRPITRVLTYAREYCTSASPSDTLQLYSEGMLEYFLCEGKVKGYKKSDANAKVVGLRRYGRMANSTGLDSIMRPNGNGDVTYLTFLTAITSVPDYVITETEAMKSGEKSDTIRGKYFPKYIYRKSDNLFTVDRDALADHKDHKWSLWVFKLLGLTMEIENAKMKTAYNITATGKYGVQDYVYDTCNLHILSKGKVMRKLLSMNGNIGIDSYIEQYPVEIEYLTVEEYKEKRKKDDDETLPIAIPDNAQPLASPIQSLVDRIDRELPR